MTYTQSQFDEMHRDLAAQEDEKLERQAERERESRRWKPIKTAPQGTMLLMCDMNAVQAANWAFVDWVVDGKCCGNRFHQPTHWMHLPFPPEKDGQS